MKQLIFRFIIHRQQDLVVSLFMRLALIPSGKEGADSGLLMKPFIFDRLYALFPVFISNQVVLPLSDDGANLYVLILPYI